MNPEVIKKLCKATGHTMTEAGQAIDLKQNSFSSRVHRDTLTDKDRAEIAKALGAVYVCGFLLPDGTWLSDDGPVSVSIEDAQIIKLNVKNQ